MVFDDAFDGEFDAYDGKYDAFDVLIIYRDVKYG